MRKNVFWAVSAILAVSLVACGAAGNTVNVTIEPIKSDIYTQEDYDEAVSVVFDYFKQFPGCTMTDIRYAGDDQEDAMKEWAEQYDMDQVIILESDFTTDEHGGDGSLNPNDTYTDWQWILARNQGGKWEHKTHGYG